MVKVSRPLITALFTRVNSVKEVAMAKAFSNSRMDLTIRETGRITSSMGKGFTTGIMVNDMLENTRTTR